MYINHFSLLVGYVTVAIVFCWCLSFALKMIRCYVLATMGFVKDLRKYGEWAVVTGATDGIGKEYARQLAKRGFNIVLISRTMAKLQVVAEEIRHESHIEVKVIEFDFSSCSEYDELSLELKDLDVGILVNNVGASYGSMDPFYKCDMVKTVNILHVNTFSDVYMTKIVLSGMVKRRRGAVIHISSASVYLDIPFANVYVATKIFINKFVRSLQLEDVNGVVDHQLVIPCYVASKMSKMSPGLTVPTAAAYVKSAINTIGITDVTHGCFVHETIAVLLKVLPAYLMSSVFLRIRKSRLEKQS